MSHYPAIRFIVERGQTLAVLIALLPIAGGLAAFILLPAHWLVVAAGVVCSLVLYLIMRSYVELVTVISEMLLPK